MAFIKTNIVSAIIAAFAFTFPLMSTQDDSAKSVVAVDEYEMTLSLDVPQVLDNMESLGRRVYKKQTIKGLMRVHWLAEGGCSFSFDDFENRSFRTGGGKVTYDVFVDDDRPAPRFAWIGSNATGKFTKPTLTLSVVMDPSYALTDPGEDNSLLITLSGKGTSMVKDGSRIAKTLSGKVSGTQGCSCYDYGHKSPTRTAGVDGPTEEATDVVSTDGNWKAKWRNRVRFSTHKPSCVPQDDDGDVPLN